MKNYFAQKISLKSDLFVDPSLVCRLLERTVTAARKERIDRVLEGRTGEVAVVLEGIYDRGNISAVMRTAEAFGFVNFHVIETQERFKEANRVTQGADKWVEVQRWKSTREAAQSLKQKGFKICVTSLEASRPLQEIDFSVPVAFVLGNEKDGVSPEMKDLADEKVIIPMTGFVQSFNISVAGALGLFHIYQERRKIFGESGRLSPEDNEYLRAEYFLRTLDSGKGVIEEFLRRSDGRA